MMTEQVESVTFTTSGVIPGRDLAAVVARAAAPAVLLAILAIEALHFWSLTKYPIVFIDESWNANTVWNWLQTGVNFDSMHHGTLDQLGHEWLRWPTLGNTPWLVSIAAFGLGLFQMRVVSWLFGVVLLACTVLAGRRSFDVTTGALAALLLSISAPFLQASHYARWDVMIAAIGMAAYLVALVAFDRDAWEAHLGAGLLVGLSLDIHLNGILFAPALAALYAMTYGRRVLLTRGTWLCALGGLLGMSVFVALKILPNPAAYFALFKFAYAFTHKLPVGDLDALDLLASVRAEIGRYHFFEYSFEFGLIGASLAFLSARRSTADRQLLIYVVTAFLGFVLFIGNKHDVYAIVLYPFLILAVAGTLLGLARDSRGAIKPFAWALLALLVVNGGVHFLRPIYNNRGYDYYAVANRIREAVPERSRVMGLPNWWLGLADYDYRSSLNVTFHHFQNGYTLTQGLEAIRPDFIIVDANLQGLLVDEGYFPPGPGFEVYRLPRRELETFLDVRGTKVLDFTDPWHGRFEIYAIRWE